MKNGQKIILASTVVTDRAIFFRFTNLFHYNNIPTKCIN